MQKFTCLLALSTLFVLASSASVTDFESASEQWARTQPHLNATLNAQAATIQYLGSIIADTACLNRVVEQIDSEMQKLADEWNYNSSILGNVTMKLLNVIKPAILLNFQACGDQNLFRQAETLFNNANTQALNKYPELKSAYTTFLTEMGFLTGQGVARDSACAQNVANYGKYTRVNGVAQLANGADPYVVSAKLVLIETVNTAKMAQKCLTGSSEDKFDSAMAYWFQKFPAQQELYTQLDTTLTNLIQKLPRDKNCSNTAVRKYQARLDDAGNRFANGISTLSEVAPLVTAAYLPDAISEVRMCVTI